MYVHTKQFGRRLGIGGKPSSVDAVSAFERSRDAVPTVNETIIRIDVGGSDDDVLPKRVHLLQNSDCSTGGCGTSPMRVVFWFPDTPGNPQDPTALWLLRALGGNVCVASMESNACDTTEAVAAIQETLATCALDHEIDDRMIHIAGKGVGADLALDCATVLSHHVASLLLITPKRGVPRDEAGHSDHHRARLPATILCTCSADYAMNESASRVQFELIRLRSSEA